MLHWRQMFRIFVLPVILPQVFIWPCDKEAFFVDSLPLHPAFILPLYLPNLKFLHFSCLCENTFITFCSSLLYRSSLLACIRAFSTILTTLVLDVLMERQCLNLCCSTYAQITSNCVFCRVCLTALTPAAPTSPSTIPFHRQTPPPPAWSNPDWVLNDETAHTPVLVQ